MKGAWTVLLWIFFSGPDNDDGATLIICEYCGGYEEGDRITGLASLIQG